MSDLISRQAAIDALDKQIEQCNKALSSFDISAKDEYAVKVERASLKAYKEQLENLPPVQPEIIRCKECRYYEWMSNRVPDEQTWFCHNWNAETGKDDYCSYAERREE